jgi:hypothetical protein
MQSYETFTPQKNKAKCITFCSLEHGRHPGEVGPCPFSRDHNRCPAEFLPHESESQRWCYSEVHLWFSPQSPMRHMEQNTFDPVISMGPWWKMMKHDENDEKWWNMMKMMKNYEKRWKIMKWWKHIIISREVEKTHGYNYYGRFVFFLVRWLFIDFSLTFLYSSIVVDPWKALESCCRCGQVCSSTAGWSATSKPQ